MKIRLTVLPMMARNPSGTKTSVLKRHLSTISWLRSNGDSIVDPPKRKSGRRIAGPDETFRLMIMVFKKKDILSQTAAVGASF